MSEELNTDVQETEITPGTIEQEVEAVVEVEQETPEVSAEDGEKTAEQEPKEETAEEKQDGVQKKINKAIRAKKEAEEATAAERARREEVEAKLKELQKVEIPDIPALPDIYDEDYEQKMAERDQIITQHAQESSRKQALAQIEAVKSQEAQTLHVKTIEGFVKGFDERTEELGLDKATLIDSQNVVSSYIPGKRELAEYLLSDKENGPLNVLYLSQDLVEMEKVSQMSETNAAVYIATQITPKAQKLKPKITNAPEPGYDPGGNKITKDTHPALVGATLE